MEKKSTGRTSKSHPMTTKLFSTVRTAFDLVIKKRSKPAEGFLYNFYGNWERGYFTFDGTTFYSASKNLDQREDVVWILIPTQLASGKIIAWPNYKSAMN